MHTSLSCTPLSAAKITESILYKLIEILTGKTLQYKIQVLGIHGTGWLVSHFIEWEDCADMTKYEKAMLCIAIIGLIIDALNLFKIFL